MPLNCSAGLEQIDAVLGPGLRRRRARNVVPGKQLDAIGAKTADLAHAPALDAAAVAAGGRFIEAMVLEREQRAALGAQQVGIGRVAVVRIDKHRPCARHQRARQPALGQHLVG
jgi:hypothetical protein